MIAAVDRDDSAHVVREFKSRVGSLTLAYGPLTNKIINAAAENETSILAGAVAQKDAGKAEAQANALYAWAGTFLPKDLPNRVNIDKASKLKMMAYAVAMAYAVRIKLDVFYVESHGVPEADRREYLERSRSTVEKFMQVLGAAMRVLLSGASLLEVAVDYHLALTTYVALKEALQASVQMMLAPRDAPRTIALWDDGLSEIR